MRVSAKADYAVRAAIELAGEEGAVVKGERIASAQQIPLNFLENILLDLKQAGIVSSRRGPDGGYFLAVPAAQVSIADIIRATEGPLATVRGVRPQNLEYAGSAEPLQQVWIALRASLRAVLEDVSLADVVAGQLPDAVVSLSDDPEAWAAH